MADPDGTQRTPSLDAEGKDGENVHYMIALRDEELTRGVTGDLAMACDPAAEANAAGSQCSLSHAGVKVGKGFGPLVGGSGSGASLLSTAASATAVTASAVETPLDVQDGLPGGTLQSLEKESLPQTIDMSGSTAEGAEKQGSIDAACPRGAAIQATVVHDGARASEAEIDSAQEKAAQPAATEVLHVPMVRRGFAAENPPVNIPSVEPAATRKKTEAQQHMELMDLTNTSARGLGGEGAGGDKRKRVPSKKVQENLQAASEQGQQSLGTGSDKRKRATPEKMQAALETDDREEESFDVGADEKKEKKKKKRAAPKKVEEPVETDNKGQRETVETGGDKKRRAAPKKTRLSYGDACVAWEETMDHHFTGCLNMGPGTDEDAESALEEAFGNAQIILKCPSFNLLEESGATVPDLTEISARLQKMLGALAKKSSSGGSDSVTPLTHALCSSMCIVRLLTAHGIKTSARTSLLGVAMQAASKILSAATGDGADEEKGKVYKRQKAGVASSGDPIMSVIEDCFMAVPDALTACGRFEGDMVIKIVRAAMDGLSSSSRLLHHSSIKILQVISCTLPSHRSNIVSELFNFGIDQDHDPKHVKKERSIAIEGVARPIPLVGAAFILVVQGIAASTLSGGDGGGATLDASRRCSMAMMALIEDRFTVRSQQKSNLKDTEAKAFVFELADSVFSVLNLPQFPVAEMILSHLADRLDHMVRGNEVGKLSEFYRGVGIEVLCSILQRLARLRKVAAQGVFSTMSPVSPVSLFKDNDPTSGLDAIASSSKAPSSTAAMPVEDLLAEQQEGYAKSKPVDSTGCGSFQSPIKVAKENRDRGALLSEQLRQLLLNHLSSQQTFVETGSIGRCAFLFYLAMWGSGEGEDNKSAGDFWQAQRDFSTRTLPDDAAPLVSVEYIEAACLRLALDRPLFSKLGARFNSLVKLMKDARYTFIPLRDESYHSEYLDNRFLAFTLVCGRPGDQVKALKTMVEGLAADPSLMLRGTIAIVRDQYVFDADNVNVRSAAVDLLSANALICMKAGMDISSDFAMLCDRSLDASLSVRLSVLSFLRGVCAEGRDNDQIDGIDRYISEACLRVSKMMGHNEESLQKGALSFFKFVWFESKECTTPAFVATRVEEIVSVVDGCTRHQDPIGTEWLERVVSTVEVEELEKCIAALAERISVIHNISVKGSSHPVKPSEFNDFETRCIQLIPVLRTLQCISKVSPQAVAGHLHAVKPVLATKEMSRGHLEVLKLTLGIIDASLLNSEPVRNELEDELFQAFSSGAFKLTDGKRFVAVDDMCKAVKCFVTVVQHFKTTKFMGLFTNVTEQNLNFLKIYIEKPEESMVAWVPRCLILAGALMRYSDSSKLSSSAKEVSEAARMQLFSVCMSHYVNHRADPVRRCAMHALGSICIKQPEIMLQEPCTKLFSKCLKSDSPPALRSQVLRNLLDHFNQEESIVADATSFSADGGQFTSKVVSDRSALLVHAFHRQMLEASLSNNATVRLDAVALLLVIMRRGLTATYLCLPYLFAQQRYPHSQAGRLSMETLADVHVKQTSQYTAQTLWDGVVKAFGLNSPNSDPSLPIDAFGCAFRLLAGTGKDYENKAVRSLLQVAMGRLERISQDVGQFSSLGDSERRDQLEFAAYITAVLASLPFVSLDSPLSIIQHANIIANDLGHRCMDQFREAADSGESVGDGLRAEGACLGLVVGLSVRIRDEYDIKPDRIRKFGDAPHIFDKTPTKDREEIGAFKPCLMFYGSGTLIDKKEFETLQRRIQRSMGIGSDANTGSAGIGGEDSVGKKTQSKGAKGKKYGVKRPRDEEEEGGGNQGKPAKQGKTEKKKPRKRQASPEDGSDEEYHGGGGGGGGGGSSGKVDSVTREPRRGGREKKQAKPRRHVVSEDDDLDDDTPLLVQQPGSARTSKVKKLNVATKKGGKRGERGS